MRNITNKERKSRRNRDRKIGRKTMRLLIVQGKFARTKISDSRKVKATV